MHCPLSNLLSARSLLSHREGASKMVRATGHAHCACQASKTAFRSHCARPDGTLHTCVSEASCPNFQPRAHAGLTGLTMDKHCAHGCLTLRPIFTLEMWGGRYRALSAAASGLSTYNNWLAKHDIPRLARQIDRCTGQRLRIRKEPRSPRRRPINYYVIVLY